MQMTARRSSSLARLSILLVLAGLLATLLAEPASAFSVRRTWTAHLGGNGSNGSAVIKGYLSGPGSIQFALTGLQPSTTFPAIVYRGSCAHPITITGLPGAVTDASGSVSKTTALSTRIMNRIWAYGRTGPIAIKVGTGALARCGPLTYPIATRIAFPSLKIDLPVVKPPSGYPLCDVAMYYPSLSQPREAGVTFLYAHARLGMFLPLLLRSRINNGASLLGMKVLVWTSNDLVSTYQVVRVRRHVTSFAGAFSTTSEQLWIQTSEGPRGTRGKLILVAKRVATVAASHPAAHPTPHPLVCH